jgi:cell filamentation protein
MEKENKRIQEALSSESKYCYDNDVLINKLGITNQKELEEVEAAFTYLKLNNLAIKQNNFKFDLMYYLNIHKYIFDDIYPFAGEIRMENITKGNTPFCRPEYILRYLSFLLEEMSKKVKNIKTIDDYTSFLAYYYSELNLVHPFREGNGRTLREFLRQMVEYLNKYLPFDELELDYSKVDSALKDKLLDGSKLSATTGNTTLLKEFFESVLNYKIINKTK